MRKIINISRPSTRQSTAAQAFPARVLPAPPPLIPSAQANLITWMLRSLHQRANSTLPLAVALCLLIAQASFAQSYSFKRYGPDEGLRTAVNRLFQDRDGFLWVGTSNGLFRYDGDRFQRFGTAEGLPASS